MARRHPYFGVPSNKNFNKIVLVDWHNTLINEDKVFCHKMTQVKNKIVQNNFPIRMTVLEREYRKQVNGIVKSEVRQSHSIFLRMFFENIQPVTRHYGAPWGAY
ncbi:MAG: hypothetical protein GY821_00070 [Gammaproteobacteria bacterium]|nr:hypothetical protein [Gammaproteobacteria bacterium]